MNIAKPHLNKIETILKNQNTPPSTKSQIEILLRHYNNWIKDLEKTSGSNDKIIIKTVELLNKYKNFVEIDIIFNSKDDFLYRPYGRYYGYDRLSRMDRLESIAQFGILSGSQLDNNTKNVTSAVKDSLTDILNKQGDDLFLSPEELGENMMRVIDNGKQSLGDVYSFGLDEVNKRISGQVTSSAGAIKNVLSGFLTSRKDELNLNLDNETIQYIRGELAALGQNKRVTLKALINLEKRLNKKITSASQPTSKGYNSEAAQELNELSSSLKDIMSRTNVTDRNKVINFILMHIKPILFSQDSFDTNTIQDIKDKYSSTQQMVLYTLEVIIIQVGLHGPKLQQNHL